MNQEKLTPEQVRHEHLRIIDEYIDAKEVIKAKRDKKLNALRERCPHENAQNEWGFQLWCNDCESEVRSAGCKNNVTRGQQKATNGYYRT